MYEKYVLLNEKWKRACFMNHMSQYVNNVLTYNRLVLIISLTRPLQVD